MVEPPVVVGIVVGRVEVSVVTVDEDLGVVVREEDSEDEDNEEEVGSVDSEVVVGGKELLMELIEELMDDRLLDGSVETPVEGWAVT